MAWTLTVCSSASAPHKRFVPFLASVTSGEKRAFLPLPLDLRAYAAEVTLRDGVAVLELTRTTLLLCSHARRDYSHSSETSITTYKHITGRFSGRAKHITGIKLDMLS